jgi:glycosyltransferase involved in cell wall biosynthesis
LRKEREKKIRITYLVDFFRTINAGTERQLGHLLTHLPEFDYSVQLISFQDSPFLKDEAPRLFPKVAIKTLGGKSDVSKSLPAFARLYFVLRSSKPGIVHTFFPASNSFGVLISRLAGTRIVISSRRDMGYNLTRKDIALLKIANRFVSCVVTNARAVQEHTIKIEGIKRKKTRVIYNGISFDDYNRSSHTNAQKEPIIGIVANLNRPVKRVDLFIKAAAIIHRDFPNVKFWIVGDGPLRMGLERLASNLGLNSNVVFMGRRGDVKKLLDEMIVGVICSDSEGLSNTILEYMGAALSVIATDVGGNPELVYHGRTGLLVPPNDAGSLAEGLIRLLKDSETACRMGDTGREFLNKKFRIDGMIQKTRDLYESFLI